MNETAQKFYETLKLQIPRVAAKIPKPHIAAFDADGTLWDTDLGELFFDYQIRESGLRLPIDPWGHYNSEKETDPCKAYLWLAQINKGQELKTVRQWAENAFLSLKPFPFLSFTRELILFLKSLDFEIYIVTASIQWAVEPGAKRLGVPIDHVIGVKTHVRDGVVTDEQDGPITWREGKANTLLSATKGVRPILTAGNTFGDIDLINCGTNFNLAIRTQKPTSDLYVAESKLNEVAVTRGWLCIDLSGHD